MRKSKISINQGYYLEGLKYNVYDIAIELIRNNIVVFGIDNDAKIYIADKNKNIISDDLKLEKKYMRVEAEYKQSELIDTFFKEASIYEQMEIYTQEKEIWIEPKYHLDLILHPFQVRVMGDDIIVYPIFKIFENNIVIINYNIYQYKQIKNEKYLDVYSDLYRNEFQKMSLPVNYAINNIRIGNEEEVYMDDERIKYVEVKTDKQCNNIKAFSKYLLSFFGKYTDNWIVYARTSYLIDLFDNKVKDSFIDTLLKGTKGNYEKELKNMSINKNIKKYYNERVTIYLGKEVLQHMSLVQTIEEMMIIQTVKDNILLYSISLDKIKYDELKEIYMNMLYEAVDGRSSKYGEIEDILQGQHFYLKRNDRLKYLKQCLQTKIQDRETYYQEKISFFALLLSAGPIVDYVLYPLMNNILHYSKIYKYVICLKSTYIGLFLNTDILKMFCFVLVILLIIYIHKKFIKGKL